VLLTAAQRQRKLNDPGHYRVFEESKAQAVAQLRTKNALDGIVELVRTCTATNPYLAKVVVRELRQLVRDTVKNLTTRYEAGELVRLYDPEPRLRQGPAPPQRRLPNTPARRLAEIALSAASQVARSAITLSRNLQSVRRF